HEVSKACLDYIPRCFNASWARLNRPQGWMSLRHRLTRSPYMTASVSRTQTPKQDMKDTTLTPPLPAQLRLCIAFCGVAIALSISNAVAQQTLNPSKLPSMADLHHPKAECLTD